MATQRTFARASRLGFVTLGAALVLALAAPGVSQAGPWDVGSTKPTKQFKVKMKLELKHTNTKDTWSRPVFKLSGPINPRLSFEVAAGYGSVKKKGQESQSGTKDLEAKLKWGLASEANAGVDVLVEPKFTFDTGDVASGVGGGVTTLKLPLRAGKSFGNFYLTGEVRYTHGFASSYTDTTGYGALVEYKPNKRWVMGVDLFNDRPVHQGGKYHLRSNFAVKYKPDAHWEWQGLLGRTIENRRGAMSTKVKFELVYKF